MSTRMTTHIAGSIATTIDRMARAVIEPDWRNSPSVQMVSGELFYLLYPQHSRCTLRDIAYALANICRFTGHTRPFYSVAEHAVRVSYALPAEHALAGLHHDDAEFVLGDVSSPLKALLPEYSAIERNVEAVLWGKFGLPAELHPAVKAADRVLLATEQRDLMAPSAADWPEVRGAWPLRDRIEPWPQQVAERRYLERHAELTAGSKA